MDAVHSGITEDELMALGPDARVEVIDGEIVAMSPVGGIHHVIVMNIARILDRYVLEHRSGMVWPDGLIFLLHRESARLKGVQVPDVSYVRTEHIPSDWDARRPFPGTPDLAVEVMSPDDKAELVLVKTRRYLEAGTEQVWVVYPEARELHQYRRGEAAENVRVYYEGENVDTAALFPGLELSTADVFWMPPWFEERLNP